MQTHTQPQQQQAATCTQVKGLADSVSWKKKKAVVCWLKTGVIYPVKHTYITLKCNAVFLVVFPWENCATVFNKNVVYYAKHKSKQQLDARNHLLP